ncbi:MAG: hypothetical protein LQ342_001749 [Letrouitia transgressa]|nr:MAG: hypothetical protein LQ342_001749 [Letrouitia transgressa]
MAGARALFLPEASDYIASTSSETVSLAKSTTASPFVLGLQNAAKENRLPINVGIHEPAQNGQKVKNTLVWIDEEGKVTQRYQKIHLFDVDIEGGPVLRESNSVEKGERILPPFETGVGRLRFPEISLALARQKAQIIAYPSAFTIPTGKAHWSTLLRARAIESQSYVVAAAQVGAHNEKRRSYGHSMIVSPWGDVVVELGGEVKEKPEMAVADIDLGMAERIKKEMPLLRRTDIYPEV